MGALNNSYRVLLVDDDEIDIKNVQRAFKKNEIINPLYIARNGLEALAMLRGTNEANLEKVIPEPNIILLDLNMPKMGGLEFLQELRKDPNYKSIPVFIMSTSDEESDKFAAYNLNVAGYILKPLSFDRFVQAIGVLRDYWQLIEPMR